MGTEERRNSEIRGPVGTEDMKAPDGTVPKTPKIVEILWLHLKLFIYGSESFSTLNLVFLYRQNII